MSRHLDTNPASPLQGVDGHEIVIPHETEIRPVSAVKNVVLQSSLTQLESLGLYERYAEVVERGVIEEIRAGLASGWSPIKLAHAHYKGCDAMGVGSEELALMGQRVGDKLQNTSLVSAAKKTRDLHHDGWHGTGALHRMWARLYQGGSVQVVKLGDTDKLLEMRGFGLTIYRYYRHGTLAVLTAANAALAARVQVRIVGYSEARDELQFRVTWG